LLALDGVGGASVVAPGVRVVWAEPGRWFAPASRDGALRGVHGGRDTQAQLAVVAGGHPAARILADVVSRSEVAAPDWPVTLAGLFGLSLADATGRNLLA
jgi:hypothetical protein